MWSAQKVVSFPSAIWSEETMSKISLRPLESVQRSHKSGRDSLIVVRPAQRAARESSIREESPSEDSHAPVREQRYRSHAHQHVRDLHSDVEQKKQPRQISLSPFLSSAHLDSLLCFVLLVAAHFSYKLVESLHFLARKSKYRCSHAGLLAVGFAENSLCTLQTVYVLL